MGKRHWTLKSYTEMGLVIDGIGVSPANAEAA
jgi:hypothetical protein